MLAVAEGAAFFKEDGGATGARGAALGDSAEGELNTVFVQFNHKPFFDVRVCLVPLQPLHKRSDDAPPSP